MTRLFFAALLGAVLVCGQARAQGAESKASAELLFDQGKALMSAGDYTKACSKFTDSIALAPGLGAMLWLADCYEQSGKTASAWAEFREAAAFAAERHDPRESVARKRAVKLEPKLSTLSINASKVAELPGLEIKRDDVVVSGSALSTPVPIDPGSHVVAASAPGHQPWKTSVDIAAASGPRSIAVPVLQLAPEPAAATATPDGEKPSDHPTDDGGTQRIIGIAVFGVGVVGGAIGTVFGLKAKSNLDDSSSHCGPGNVCDPTGIGLRSSALDAATLSTVAFVVGAAGLAGGLVLYFTAPRGQNPIRVGVGWGGRAPELRLGGSW